MLERMEAGGLLVSQRTAQDERQVAVQLTPKGRALETKASAVSASFGDACALQEKEIAGLQKKLNEVRNRLLDAPSA